MKVKKTGHAQLLYPPTVHLFTFTCVEIKKIIKIYLKKILFDFTNTREMTERQYRNRFIVF